MSGADTDETEAVMVAVRHKTRREILRQVAGDGSAMPVSPVELARRMRKPISHVSYHVRVLAKCELIRLVRTKRVRNSTQHFYLTTERVNHPVAKALIARAER